MAKLLVSDDPQVLDLVTLVLEDARRPPTAAIVTDRLMRLEQGLKWSPDVLPEG